MENTSRVMRNGQVATGLALCLVAVALMLGAPPALAVTAAKPIKAPSGKLTVTAVCASGGAGSYESVSVTGRVTGLRPNTSFGVAVLQPPSFQVTAQDPVLTSDAKGALTLNAVVLTASTDGYPPYTAGAASFDALYTGLIGVQGGGAGLVADLNVVIDTSKCP